MATNFFLKLDGIKAESTDSKHAGEIQVLSWSHSFNQPTSPTRSSAGSGTVEQANHADFSFTKYIDTATDDLLKACWTGQQIKSGVFKAYRSSGAKDDAVNYLEIDFTGIIVSNYSISGGTGDVPVETVTLSYSIVKYIYILQKDEDGTGSGQEPVQHDLMKQVVS
jgi:type VI secretion system secreted protein Hcp